MKSTGIVRGVDGLGRIVLPKELRTSMTAWVLHNENLDYLHCNDLSWDGKHSCRDKVNK